MAFTQKSTTEKEEGCEETILQWMVPHATKEAIHRFADMFLSIIKLKASLTRDVSLQILDDNVDIAIVNKYFDSGA